MSKLVILAHDTGTPHLHWEHVALVLGAAAAVAVLVGARAGLRRWVAARKKRTT